MSGPPQHLAAIIEQDLLKIYALSTGRILSTPFNMSGAVALAKDSNGSSATGSDPDDVRNPNGQEVGRSNGESYAEPRRIVPKNLTSLAERKRVILYHTPERVAFAMEQYVEQEMMKIDRSDDESCWLHPSPRQSLHSITKWFQWKDDTGTHSVQLHIGVVMLLLTDRITDAQAEGLINEGWHLSHLCGNWTCCNYTHFTVEPGPINVARNACFAQNRQCKHSPCCMKDKKLPQWQLLPPLFVEETLFERLCREIPQEGSFDEAGDQYQKHPSAGDVDTVKCRSEVVEHNQNEDKTPGRDVGPEAPNFI